MHIKIDTYLHPKYYVIYVIGMLVFTLLFGSMPLMAASIQEECTQRRTETELFWTESQPFSLSKECVPPVERTVRTDSSQRVDIPVEEVADGNTVLVQFEPETTEEERDVIIAEIGGTLTDWLAPIHLAQIYIPADNGSVDVSGLLITYSQISFAEFDYEISGFATTNELPDDPDLFDATKVYAPQRIKATEAWNLTIGDPDIVVAVVDSGVNTEHPEFIDRLVPGYDFISDDDVPQDEHGHGTHVAGIIAAAINNGQGAAGICPRCRIMPIKVLNANNTGTWFTAAKGVIYAADHGARILNLSFGSHISSHTIENAVRYAQERGCLIVVAAGNNGSSQFFYPAALPDVLAVSATDQEDNSWNLSNHGNYIDVAAPGYLIYSAYTDLNNKYDGYTFMNGTSMAAPQVSGLAGLLLSQNPERTAHDLRHLITENADDLGDEGWDGYYGHGRVNALAALSVEAELFGSNADNTLHICIPVSSPDGNAIFVPNEPGDDSASPADIEITMDIPSLPVNTAIVGQVYNLILPPSVDGEVQIRYQDIDVQGVSGVGLEGITPIMYYWDGTEWMMLETQFVDELFEGGFKLATANTQGDGIYALAINYDASIPGEQFYFPLLMGK